MYIINTEKLIKQNYSMKIKNALALTALTGSLLHAMDKPLNRVELKTGAANQSSNEWMTGTYFGLLPRDLHGSLKEIMRREPVVFGYAIEANVPVILGGHGVYSAKFNGAGDKVVTASDEKASIWNVKDGSLRATLDFCSQTDAGHPVNIAEKITSRAKIWKMEDDSYVVVLRDVFCEASFATLEDKVVIIEDAAIKILKVENGALITTLGGNREWTCAARFNRAGDKLVTPSMGNTTATIWKVENGSLIASLIGHSNSIVSVEFNPLGDQIVTASEDGTARIWRAEDGTFKTALIGHDDIVLTAQFNAAGDKVVTASRDKTAKLWRPDGSLILTLSGHSEGLELAQFNLTGGKIVTASLDNMVKIWNCVDGSLLATLTGSGHVRRAHFGPDDEVLTASWDKEVQLRKAKDLSFIQLIALYAAMPLWKGSREVLFKQAKELAAQKKIDLVEALIEVLLVRVVPCENSRRNSQNIGSNCNVQ